MTKTERLIGVLTLLLRERKTTISILAKKFEVSYRTMYRDIEAIDQAGIPIITTSGYNGGVEISPYFLLDNALLTSEEIQTILTGLKSIDSISENSTSQKISQKLTLNCKKNEREAISIDLTSFHKTNLTMKFELINAAIAKQHRISFLYHSEKGTSQRVIEPQYIIFKWSSWYVYGFCKTNLAFRLFKLNRLSELLDTGEAFQSQQTEIAMEDNNYFEEAPIKLTALFDKTVQYKLIEEYGIENCSTFSKDKILFQWDFTSYNFMLTWILSFGDKVSVIEPKELIIDIIQQSKNILDKYKELDT